MPDEIGPATDPDAIPCDDACERQAQLVIVSLADRGVDYVCWPCLLARTVKIAADASGMEPKPLEGGGAA